MKNKILFLLIGAFCLTGCNNRPNQPNKHNVTFNYNCEINNKTSEVKEIEDGNKISSIDLSRDGYSLDGWYLDNESFSNKYNFDNLVTKDLSLYAKWEEEIKNYNVVFHYNSEIDNKTFSTVVVEEGHKVTVPQLTRENYYIEGWYLDDTTFANKFDLNSVINSNIHLYANWKMSTVYLTGLSFNENSVIIDKNDSEPYALSWEYVPNNTTQLGVSWSSSDTTVATVSNDGKVKGLKAGTAVITLTSSVNSSISETIDVTVTDSKMVTLQEAKDALSFKGVEKVEYTVTIKSEIKDSTFITTNAETSTQCSFDGNKIKMIISEKGSGTLNKKGYFDYYEKRHDKKSQFQFEEYLEDVEESIGESRLIDDTYYFTGDSIEFTQYGQLFPKDMCCEFFSVVGDETYYSLMESDSDDTLPGTFHLNDIDFDSMTYDNDNGCYHFNDVSLWGFSTAAIYDTSGDIHVNDIKAYFADKLLKKVEANFYEERDGVIKNYTVNYVFKNYGNVTITLPSKDSLDICNHSGRTLMWGGTSEYHYKYCSYCHDVIKGSVGDHNYVNHVCTVCGAEEYENEVYLSKTILGKTVDMLYRPKNLLTGSYGGLISSHSCGITPDYCGVILPGETEIRVCATSKGSSLFYGCGKKTYAICNVYGIVFLEEYTFEKRTVDFGGTMQEADVIVATKLFAETIRF